VAFTPEQSDATAAHRAALEHGRDVAFRDLGAGGATTPGGAGVSFEKAVENTYSEGRGSDPDRGHEKGRDTEQTEHDEADQERQHDGRVEPLCASLIVHRPSTTKVLLTGRRPGRMDGCARKLSVWAARVPDQRA